MSPVPARGTSWSTAGNRGRSTTAYAPWLDALVLDRRDAACAAEVRRLALAAVPADTLMTDRTREIALARVVLTS